MSLTLLDDPLSIIVIILIFWAIGRKCVEGTRALHRAGWHMAIIVFVATFALIGYASHPFDAEGWLGIAFQAAFIAGLALGPAWIVLAMLSFLSHLVIARPLRTLKRWREHLQRERTRRAHERRIREEREEYERRAPDRERARTQAEEESRARVDAQRRRDTARANALLTYSLHATKLGDRFPKALFDEYVKSYMTDALPPEIVEERGQELKATLEQHRADVDPRRVSSIASLATWFQQMRDDIEALPIDQSLKIIHLIKLEEEFDRLLKLHMERGQP